MSIILVISAITVVYEPCDWRLKHSCGNLRLFLNGHEQISHASQQLDPVLLVLECLKVEIRFEESMWNQG